jgi:hypothetical protein
VRAGLALLTILHCELRLIQGGAFFGAGRMASAAFAVKAGEQDCAVYSVVRAVWELRSMYRCINNMCECSTRK